MSRAAYPLYILEEDDFSFRQVQSELELDWYERTDIEDELYRGWDSHGHPFRLTWDIGKRRPDLELSNQPDWEGFESAVERYLIRTKSVDNFPPGYCNPSYLVRFLRRDRQS